MSDHIEFGTTGKHHPYHLVRPSIWPMIGAFAGGLFAVGMLLFMHDIEVAGVKSGHLGSALGCIVHFGCNVFLVERHYF